MSDKFGVGTACAVTAVVGDDDGRLQPSLTEPEGAVVSCPERTLTTPAAKRAWAERSGADLVDLESAAFARIAVEKGWVWAVVRGVSDGPDATLPGDIDTWVDGSGRARPGRVFRAIRRGDVGIRRLMRLRADGVAAMSAAAAVLQRMLGR